MTADKDSRGAHLGRWVTLCLYRIEGAADREDCDSHLRSLTKLLRPCENMRVEFYLDDIVLRLLIAFCRFGPSPALEQCAEVLRAKTDAVQWGDDVDDVLQKYGDEFPRAGDFATYLRTLPRIANACVS